MAARPQPVEEPAAKRLRTEGSSGVEGESIEVATLKLQKQNLAALVKVARQDAVQLQKRVVDLDERVVVYERTLALVHVHFDVISAHLTALLGRIRPEKFTMVEFSPPPAESVLRMLARSGDPELKRPSAMQSDALSETGVAVALAQLCHKVKRQTDAISAALREALEAGSVPALSETAWKEMEEKLVESVKRVSEACTEASIEKGRASDIAEQLEDRSAQLRTCSMRLARQLEANEDLRAETASIREDLKSFEVDFGTARDSPAGDFGDTVVASSVLEEKDALVASLRSELSELESTDIDLRKERDRFRTLVNERDELLDGVLRSILFGGSDQRVLEEVRSHPFVVALRADVEVACVREKLLQTQLADRSRAFEDDKKVQLAQNRELAAKFEEAKNELEKATLDRAKALDEKELKLMVDERRLNESESMIKELNMLVRNVEVQLAQRQGEVSRLRKRCGLFAQDAEGGPPNLRQLTFEAHRLRQDNFQLREELADARLYKETLKMGFGADRRTEFDLRETVAALNKRVRELERFEKSESTFKEMENRLREAVLARETAESFAKTVQQENDAVAAELEAVAGAFEEVQNQNSRLLKSACVEGDDPTSLLHKERISSLQVQALMREENSVVNMQLASLQHAAAARKKELDETRESSKLVELSRAKLKDDLRVAQDFADQCKKKEYEAHQEAMKEKFAHDAASREKEELTVQFKLRGQRLFDLQQEMQAVKASEARLEAQLKRFENVEVPETELEILKREVLEWRQKVKCKVCRVNDVSMAIGGARSCGHCFCSDCLLSRVKNRARKCPGCGQQFSETDLVPIYL